MVEGSLGWWHPDPASLGALVPGAGVEGALLHHLIPCTDVSYLFFFLF